MDLSIKNRMLKMSEQKLNKEAIWPFNKKQEKEEAKQTKSPQQELDEQLLDAVYSGSTLKVKKLLQQGANPNTYTTLSAALDNDKIEVFKILLENGADPNGTGNEFNDGDIPIFNAINKKNIAAVSALIEKNVDLEVVTSSNWNVIHYAASVREPEILLMLLNNVSSPYEMVNRKNSNGYLPESYNYGNKQVEEILNKYKPNNTEASYKKYRLKKQS